MKQSMELALFLELLRAGILGEDPDLTPFRDQLETLDRERVRQLAIQHDVVLTVYNALNGVEEPQLLKLKKDLRGFYGPSLAKSVNQDSEGKALLEAFEQAGMDCIPLKGWVLREFYADPLSRSMADLDILVRDYQFEKMRAVMEPLGYHVNGRSAWKHDEFFKEPYLNVEVHKRLTDNSGPVRAWERQIWDHCTREAGTEHRYSMSDEDFYIFHLVHMYKDFKNGALGFRRLADLWILRKNYGEEICRAAEKKLEDMNMGLFAKRMACLSAVCFDRLPMDLDSETLLQYAAEGAVYTSDKRYKLGRMASVSGKTVRTAKLHSIVRAVFLPYNRMKAQFPLVEKYPLLLPWFWGKRMLHYAKHPVSQLKKLNYSELTVQQYDEMKQVFRAGGILQEEAREKE